ncbi:DNA topoisomerase 3 [Candidatus Ornithobacterium hominis]|uniref:DNA topoisomerase n=1 Tax=Candidatus Ornithobacterium hominis TaxID=2497989 RepID=A0A383U5F1_9FLAO|nr:type IA DNA topoisomerase [Candidatus Ornithobacterium hominis]MCT7905249.1 DNA topoisomerase [Candidatus Ornithobacterium hominis]SZD74351.1 DNA topoisomerase 3 [Candidatus Ornithobacterium hominis]
MKLIIAEKPTQAKDYAKALGGFNSKNGYLENSEYYITWCFGHLIELERDTAYRNEGKWSKDYLPLIPKKYQYKIGSGKNGKPDAGKKKQLDIIQNLMNKSSSIINATDADREGELIFMYVYNYLNCKLPFQRLWISSLTDGDIKKGFQNLLPSTELANLNKSAYARAIADWLVGINGTQASTLQFGNGSLLTIGRVQTAILKIICERYLKHKNHTKAFTYKIRANHSLNIDFHSETEAYEAKTSAENILAKLSLSSHRCINVENSVKKVAPPLLFSIDTLIIEANKHYGYTGKQTLDLAQKLYEKKLTSYPRTDSEYINQENFDKLKTFLPSFSKSYLNIDFSFSANSPKSVNDKKLTGSHDAIVPTGENSGIDSLLEPERNLYNLILARCLQSFSPPAEYNKTKITFDNQSILFNTYGSKLMKLGWKKYELKNTDEKDIEEQELDIKIQPNQIIEVKNFELKEIESKPPALYSEVNLTKDLTNFGTLLKEEKPELLEKIKSNIDIKSLQIGTQATRPAIIERLKFLKFIELKKNKFLPTEKGLEYYNIIKDLQVSDVITTAIWEMKLKKVAEGTEDVKLFYKEITDFTNNIVQDIFSKDTKLTSITTERKTLGKCPKCSDGNILEGKKSFGCTNWKKGCDFTIWKTIAGKKISELVIQDLISKKETRLLKGFKSKTGKSFDTRLKLNNEFKIEFDFNK